MQQFHQCDQSNHHQQLPETGPQQTDSAHNGKLDVSNDPVVGIGFRNDIMKFEPDEVDIDFVDSSNVNTTGAIEDGNGTQDNSTFSQLKKSFLKNGGLVSTSYFTKSFSLSQLWHIFDFSAAPQEEEQNQS
ncbi:MAG: hypothetical protein GY816_15670 [Cytophagales bacterium]|nr:hypothetical protein [Cytophagales bacterium]